MLDLLLVPVLQDKLSQPIPPPAATANDPYAVRLKNSRLFMVS